MKVILSLSPAYPNVIDLAPKREFKSYLLTDKYDRPWTDDKRLSRIRYSNWIVWAFILFSIPLIGYINYYLGYKRAVKHDYCLVLEDNFSKLDTSVWNHEVQVNGFGTGSFDWTTTDPRNAYVDSEGLHIVPILTTDSTPITSAQILNGDTGKALLEDCSASSNSTTGSVIPSVRSARLNTKSKKSITYGRVEVIAKLPSGDWLWPAIWMMPETDTYGPWPASGEIDIMESRGNDVLYPKGGKDTFSSTLHWGPSALTDAYWRTTHSKLLRRTTLAKGFHTYGLEWSEDYLFTYIDNRLQTVLYMNFKKNMWDFGNFAGAMENQTLLNDPWSKTGHKNAPFDQKFFLILNVAVGGRNGYFPDGTGSKPWVDDGTTAGADFYKAKDQWYPTWGKGSDSGMIVKSVKMWQQGKCS
ncbi:putative secreted glucosidase [Microthyrium microscopicum]|uniref:Putative secreted glucosidase n=1 Tax=Microthyrium microscopicum TaxID=703497 RepID=A0A6A6U900_9PEZI|nr:putative secreted glucosidase [Microthyrium microscopicum]